MISLDLAQSGAAGPARSGAKAARLGIARSMGLRVLPGRVLPPEVLGEHLSTPERLEELLAGPRPDDPAGRRRQRVFVQEELERVRWLSAPDSALAGLVNALGEAPRGFVVRSSALQEDGAQSSWAGIFESVFCARELDALAEAIRVVWASQWSYRAHLYARRTGRSVSRAMSASMAVLIQPAIEPEVGGVAFSRNPVEPDACERLVEATWGLPSAVVDGSGSVDRYTFGPGVSNLQTHLGTKKTRFGLGAEGVLTRPVEATRQRASSLSLAQLSELDELVATLEQMFSGYQDVEWAFSDQQLLLLQTRPQTALGHQQGLAQHKGTEQAG